MTIDHQEAPSPDVAPYPRPDARDLNKAALAPRLTSTPALPGELEKVVQEIEKRHYSAIEYCDVSNDELRKLFVQTDKDRATLLSMIRPLVEEVGRLRAGKAKDYHYTRDGHGIIDEVCKMFARGTFNLGEGDALVGVQEAFIKYVACSRSSPPSAAAEPKRQLDPEKIAQLIKDVDALPPIEDQPPVVFAPTKRYAGAAQPRPAVTVVDREALAEWFYDNQKLGPLDVTCGARRKWSREQASGLLASGLLPTAQVGG